jgi:aspartate racemase
MTDPARRIADRPADAHGKERTAAVGAPSIPRRGTSAPCPASFAQEEIWLFDQLVPQSAVFHIAQAVDLRGRLDRGALQEALDVVVARHEALRTTLQAIDGRPFQVIAPPRPVSLTLVELEDGARSGPEDVQRRLVEDARRPFDLTRDLMLRVTLFRLHAEHHVLLLTMHHVASDGWSVGLLFRELTECYAACSSGRRPALQDLPIQYADYAQWQRDRQRGPALEQELAYWKRQLAHLTPLRLPTDRPRPVRQTYGGAREPFRIPAEAAAALKALSRQERVTTFMTLLAAFLTLLHRYTGQDDIAVGSPIAGRTRVELEEVIGLVVNTLVLRADLSGNPTFRQLLARVREIALDAYAHLDLPFERLVQELRPARTLSQRPFFQVMLSVDNRPLESLTLPGLTAHTSAVGTDTSMCDLILYIQETAHGVVGRMEYDTALFDATTISRMLGHFEVLLAGIAADPDRPLSALPLLTESERRQVLVEWNDTRRDYPADRCIHELFEAQTAQTPHAVALAFEDAVLTYDELNRRANQLAHHLRALGVGPDVPVAICVERSLEMIVGLLGILKAGGAYVPLDPAYPRQRLAFLLGDTRAPVLLTQASLRVTLHEQGTRVLCLDADWPAIARETDATPVTLTTPEHLAYIMYTSGSTGQPKGVSVPHRAVVRLVKNTTYARLTSDEVFLLLAPLAFDASTFEIWGSLLNGACLAIAPPGVPSVAELAQVLRRHEVTTLWLNAAFFHQVVDEDIESLGPVRQLLAGGDVLSVPHVMRVLRERPGCQLVNGYGPTETTTFACCYPVRAPEQVGSSVPIGRPIANTRVYVLDRYREPVPIGVPGELYIGGDGVARGYLNRPELTAERFLSDPFGDAPDGRLYRTGDLVRYRPDGALEFLGRVDHQVKIRGFRIEPGEIESVLRLHPAVREAVVIAQQEAPGDKYLVAYLEARGAPDPSSDHLRQYLETRLPPYMIPSAFVQLTALPLTPTGKVDRQALPVFSRSDLLTHEPDSVGPRDAVEARLVEIWEDVLRVRPIGVTHDFFQLGGHSLLATQMVARIQKRFGKTIPLTVLFVAPTIAQLAAALRDQTAPASWPRVAAIQPEGTRPPFLCVDAGAFFRPLARRLGPDQPFLGLPLDAAALPTPFTMEDIAAYHVQTIREVQPRGPYVLGGWSAAGGAAYEIAQQLRGQGEEVALLVLFDCTNPAQHTAGSRQGLARVRLPRWTQRLGFHWGNLRRGPLRDAPSYIRERSDTIREKLKERAWRARYALRLWAGRPIHRRLRDAEQIALFAYRTYRPRPYPGRVVLFRCSERPHGPYWDPASGWRELVGHGLEVHEIPGNHRTVFLEPNVEILARTLRTCLEANPNS